MGIFQRKKSANRLASSFSVGNSSMRIRTSGYIGSNRSQLSYNMSSSDVGGPRASSSLFAIPWPTDIEFGMYEKGKESETSIDESVWKTALKKENEMPQLVTHNDLKLHKTKVSGWIAINELVWDISGFVDRHPGGSAPISQGLGKDATKLFTEVHPHIKVEKEIGVSLVGIYMTDQLKRVSIAQPEGFNCKTFLKSFTSCCCCRKTKEAKINVKYKENINFVLLEIIAKPDKNQDRVGFGPWSWTVILMESRFLLVRAMLKPPFCWCADYTLHKELQQEFLYLNFKDNYRKLQILFKKPRPRIWNTLGDPIRTNTIAKWDEFEDESICHLFEKRYISEYVFIVGFKIRPSSYIGFPPGHFVRLTANVEGHTSSEWYSPVPYTLVHEPEPTCKEKPGQSVFLMMKLTEEDDQAKWIHDIPYGSPGDDADIFVTIGRSFGDFSLTSIDDADVVILLAYDTGIAPLCSIIQFYLEQGQESIGDKHVVLMYFNYSDEDCVWKSEWNYLNDGCPWFHVFLCVENPSPTWDQLTGHVSRSLIKGCLRAIPDIFADLRIKGVASGNKEFLRQCQIVFKKMEYFFDQTYVISPGP